VRQRLVDSLQSTGFSSPMVVIGYWRNCQELNAEGAEGGELGVECKPAPLKPKGAAPAPGIGEAWGWA